MDIRDISDASFGERVEHYRSRYQDPDSDVLMIKKLAEESANAEMLDEIHTMLRELLRINGVRLRGNGFR